jgi:hypothetical protein
LQLPDERPTLQERRVFFRRYAVSRFHRLLSSFRGAGYPAGDLPI